MNDSNNSPSPKLTPEMVKAIEAALAAYPRGTLVRVGIRNRRNSSEYATLYFELDRPIPLPPPVSDVPSHQRRRGRPGRPPTLPRPPLPPTE